MEETKMWIKPKGKEPVEKQPFFHFMGTTVFLNFIKNLTQNETTTISRKGETMDYWLSGKITTQLMEEFMRAYVTMVVHWDVYSKTINRKQELRGFVI